MEGEEEEMEGHRAKKERKEGGRGEERGGEELVIMD